MAQPKILLTRIDDRFIYGQDVELWNEAMGSNLGPNRQRRDCGGFAQVGAYEGRGA